MPFSCAQTYDLKAYSENGHGLDFVSATQQGQSWYPGVTDRESAPCAHADMAALKMAALGATPSAATRWNSSSASCQCPAFSAAQIRLV